MRRRRLFDDPPAWKQRRALLQEQGCPDPQDLMEVEVTLAAMQMLGLDDEIVGGGAYLLTGTLLYPHSALWTDPQRRILANARQLSPFRSRWAWRDALLEYAGRAPKWRLYDLLDSGPDAPARDDRRTDSEPWENVTVNVAFCPERAETAPCRENLAIYRQCLSEPLPYASNPGAPADADTVYTFQVKPHGDPVDLSVRFPQGEMPPPFTPAPVIPRTREQLCVNVKRDLDPVAKDLDKREADLAARFGWLPHELGNWQGRLAKIHLREVEDGTVADKDEQILHLDGFHHAAGMVASGKSTLSLLLAAYFIQRNRDKRDAVPLRLTLVVGDTQSSLRLANQINWWFCDDPEADTPVAVALLGRSGRERHGRALQASRDYQEGNRRGQAHFGERWLSSTCPLQGFIPSDEITRILQGETLPLGQEPCQHLQDADKPKDPKRLCPLFGICPSQQTFHDLPHATIWITTPQAMALGSVPRHIEPRPIHLGEMLYERSDLVIFDEADAIMAHFDDTYAVEVALMGGDGVYDRVSVDMERDLSRHRVRDTGQQKWAAAERDGIKASEGLLTLLRVEQEHPYLSQWVRQGFFTPGAVLHRLVRRIAGIPESPHPDTPQETLKSWEDAAKKVRALFDPLLTVPSNPLRPIHRDTFAPATARLYQILQDINREGPASGRSRNIHLDCRRWLTQTFENLEATLQSGAALAAAQQQMRRARCGKKPKEAPPPAPYAWPYLTDDLTTLAYRLQFTLSVFLVDLHGRYLFEAWDNKVAPGEADVSPFHRIPAVMQDILPLPPVGAQFGMYFSARDDEGRPRDHLARFCYTNIGRWYFLNFHRLLTDLTGELGPHVLALSGTSYLPDSVRFHVGWQGTLPAASARPTGGPPPPVIVDPAFPRSVLVPEDKASEAIEQSEFVLAPVLHPNRTPLRLSGVEQRLKPEAFHHLANSLSAYGDDGLLGRELALLRERAVPGQKTWEDRARLLLLVNSYKQAAWVAAGLRVGWPECRERVYHLRQQEPQAQDIHDALRFGGLPRSDIETFAQTGGDILVAPISAIGRGFNILNRNGVAAFGSVYFLVRPYPHPQDTGGYAAEMNRRALEWAACAAFEAWEPDSLAERAARLRRIAGDYWRAMERRTYYSTLHNEERWLCFPRADLAAYTAAILVQAAGRLVRGGVPFRAHFVDAAWASGAAHRMLGVEQARPRRDTAKTSLLIAVQEILARYSDNAQNPIGAQLYKPLSAALNNLMTSGGGVPPFEIPSVAPFDDVS